MQQQQQKYLRKTQVTALSLLSLPKNDTTLNTHSGFLFHLMRPSEHLALMSYTRTPMSLAHATNWAFHLIFCTPPSASYRTVDFSRDKKVFSWSTNRSSPTEKNKEMWIFISWSFTICITRTRSIARSVYCYMSFTNQTCLVISSLLNSVPWGFQY